MRDDKQQLVDKLNEMTEQICATIIKQDINPWDGLAAIFQSIMVVSAASGIPLESIAEHMKHILTHPTAVTERNKLETEYKKEASKNKNHLAVAPK